MRLAIIFAALAPAAGWATTLEMLTVDQMIQQSTAIVRVKVTGATTSLRGRDIYTAYQFTLLETLKPGASAATSVSVPGGAVHGVRQMVAGAPTLTNGQEYVIFLWTSRSGLTQIIGLSQGLFAVGTDASGNAVLSRPAASGVTLSQNGTAVQSSAVTMTLAALRAEIQKVLG